MATVLELRMTPEEYLAWERDPERAQERKSEYIGGEAREAPPSSLYHNLITTELIVLFGRQLPDYDVLVSQMRIWIQNGKACVYPDIVIVGDEAKFLDDQFDTLLNPTLLVEILSPSTSDYDRGPKLDLYRDIESLTDYLIVSQDEARIEHYAREGDNVWLLKSHRGPDATAHIDSLDCDLPLAEIYARIDFNR